MEKYKEKLLKLRKHPRQFRLCLGGCIALVVLLAVTCISVGIQGNIQSKYTGAIELMQEQLYQSMIDMTQTFAYIDDPSVDVQNKLIPELRSQYARVDALNTALTEGFGPEYAVLDETLTAAVSDAFEQYAAAYRTMSPVGLATADMQECIDEMQGMITARYEDHSEDPVIIE